MNFKYKKSLLLELNIVVYFSFAMSFMIYTTLPDLVLGSLSDKNGDKLGREDAARRSASFTGEIIAFDPNANLTMPFNSNMSASGNDTKNIGQ